MKYAFIAAQLDAAAGYSVVLMCRMLGVGRQGFYEWQNGNESARARRDGKLTDEIREIMAWHQQRLGVRRVRRKLARAGYRVVHKRVHRLMRAAGLRCKHPRPYRVTTIRGVEPEGLVDLVRRDCTAAAPGGNGSTTSPTSIPVPGGRIWPQSSTATPAQSWAGRWPRICAPTW